MRTNKKATQRFDPACLKSLFESRLLQINVNSWLMHLAWNCLLGSFFNHVIKDKVLVGCKPSHPVEQMRSTGSQKTSGAGAGGVTLLSQDGHLHSPSPIYLCESREVGEQWVFNLLAIYPRLLLSKPACNQSGNSILLSILIRVLPLLAEFAPMAPEQARCYGVMFLSATPAAGGGWGPSRVLPVGRAKTSNRLPWRVTNHSVSAGLVQTLAITAARSGR